MSERLTREQVESCAKVQVLRDEVLALMDEATDRTGLVNRLLSDKADFRAHIEALEERNRVLREALQLIADWYDDMPPIIAHVVPRHWIYDERLKVARAALEAQ